MTSNFDILFRRLITSQTFVRGWGNPSHLQELCASRRTKVAVRSECLKLVPPESVQENTIQITKREVKGDTQYIDAKFPSPLAIHFPHLVPPEVATAHFQLVLPHDHRLGVDSIPIGICYPGTGDHGYNRRRLLTAKPLLKQYRIGSIIIENPYYGFRKPHHQARSSLCYVTDLLIMGGALMLETMVLLYWCEKMKLTPPILHGFSLGGHMASLAFTSWPGPLSLLSCASWSTSSTAFCDGVLSSTIPWELLKKQFYENRAYQTFYEFLREGRKSTDSKSAGTAVVVDPIKDMMRLVMDEFTSLEFYARPVASNMLNAMFIICKNDGYILRDGTPDMNDLWPGCLVRTVSYGHISAFIFSQSTFLHATAEMLQRQQPNVKLKKNPVVTLINVTASSNT
ncbi:unnamed protein product [Rotaria socialis]|uniref:Abhydrolase domain containing 18 n=1 Tax=Rotaria socialis TaxID=392032 RepID=A0A817MYW6_9BILA|nr:unnamed protein product [Rotaria socialis]CAF3193677.1 unnamed protein product [Rotaria socialis]CAF3398589.1 unnamed protein product [Rotaria socialis]CAF3440208.1 unnamed protein product [Rotaria socialis]CAF4244179.1 unnamed protein product [Rotaria socialis]